MPGFEQSALGGAFLLGLFGGVHCLGMCGGIAAALSQQGSGAAIAEAFVYNGARIASYAGVGAIAGGLGQAMGGFVGPTFTVGLRVALGIWFVGLGLQLAGVVRPFARLEKFGLAFWRRLAPAASRARHFRPLVRLTILGALWGWLPCGLVYAAAVGSAASGSAAVGAGLMIAFGLGTLPWLVASGTAVDGLMQWAGARRARSAAGLLLAVAGLWTILGAIPWDGAHGGHAAPAHTTEHEDRA